MKLVEIARKHPSRFSQIEWSAMGKHHAQALFARCKQGTDHRIHETQHTLYFECVQEAAKYKLERAEGFEKDYWRSFIIALNIAYLNYERTWGPFLVTQYGRTVANAKTGTLIA